MGWGYRCDRRRWARQVLFLAVLLACAVVLGFPGLWESSSHAGLRLLRIVAGMAFESGLVEKCLHSLAATVA